MHTAAPREAGARRDTSLEVFKAAFSEGTWPFVGEVGLRREGSSWDTNRCLRASEDSARVRIFSEEDPSESLTVSELTDLCDTLPELFPSNAEDLTVELDRYYSDEK